VANPAKLGQRLLKWSHNQVSVYLYSALCKMNPLLKHSDMGRNSKEIIQY